MDKGPTETSFADHFSGHANEYAASRPTYPKELFEFLSKIAPRNNLAWDCATGSGQAANALAVHFDRVIATDASQEQIQNAVVGADNIEFRTAPAENSRLDEGSVDLITVAQALHWFNFEAFFTEVSRVATPKALLAVWSYELTKVTPGIDEIIVSFYRGRIDNYWPDERLHVETQYRNIAIPFEPIDTPDFEMSQEWTADEMLAYLRTWSAVKRCQADIGIDAVDEIDQQLRTAWGTAVTKVKWPLTLKLFRIN